MTTARVSTPRTGDDAAAVTLMDLAVCLPDAGDLTRELKRLELRWADKLDLVRGKLAAAGDLVVLFDEPVLLPRSSAPQDAFERRRIEVAEMVTNAAPKIVFTAEPSAMLLHPDHVSIPTRSGARALLAQEHWGEWASFAAALAAAGGNNLDAWSPLALRMAVALIAHGQASASALVERPHGVRSLAPRVVALVRRDPGLRKLAESLALVRLPFAADLLDRLEVGALASESKRLLSSVLTYEVDGRLVCHDVFARVLLRSSMDLAPDERTERTAAHHTLATYYGERFERAGAAHDLGKAVRFEMEAVHHLTEAGDSRALERFTPFFVEQWDALGKVLGQARKHEEAVRCYEQALEHDPEDAYAHHYKAFNLDCLAVRVSEVEHHYREAIRLDPSHVWHHGRFDCFLVTRGRVGDARRAWTAALADLAPGGDYRSESVYEELHQGVARLLLHRGELEFAREVLNDVETYAVKGSEWFRALSLYLHMLAEAARDEVVFPPHVPVNERWVAPHTVPEGSVLEGLLSWMPGRVARVDDTEVHVRVAAYDGSSPSYGWRTFDAARLRAMTDSTWDIPAGTFIEILSFEGDREVVRTHAKVPFEPRLPGIYPRPDRYLRRVASRT